MSEANDEAGPVVVVVAPGAEAPGGSGEGVQVQVGEDGEAEAVGEVADAAVQIAEIEAERDVTLAVIQAETVSELAAATENEELDRCRLRIAELEGLNTGLREEVETLRALIPPPSPEPPPSPPEPPPGPDVAVQELEPAANPESAPEPPPPARRRQRWI